MSSNKSIHGQPNKIQASLRTFCQRSRGGNKDRTIKNIESFIQHLEDQAARMVDDSLQQKRVYVGIKRRNWGISYDDILHPYWQRFVHSLNLYQKEVHEFGIVSVHLSKRAFDLLTPVLEKKNIQVLVLNSIGRDGIFFASDVLRACPSLEKLSLVGIPIDDLDVAAQLSRALNDHPSLKKLFLYRCSLGIFNNEILSQIINASRGVKHIVLNSNKIGLQGSIAISAFLATDPGVESLELSDNELNDEAASHLASSLKKNKNLRQLCLDGNEISSTGKQALCNALFDKSSLNAIVESNHTCVVWVHDEYEMDSSEFDDETVGLLGIKKSSTAKENRERKIFCALHSEGRLKLDYLNGVQLNLMPHVLELLLQDTERQKSLSNIFEVLCWGVSLLFKA